MWVWLHPRFKHSQDYQVIKEILSGHKMLKKRLFTVNTDYKRYIVTGTSNPLYHAVNLKFALP